MTQYHYDRPTTAVETPAPPQNQDARTLRELSARVESQDQEITELRQMVRRLQNEIRSAVSAFNLRKHG